MCYTMTRRRKTARGRRTEDEASKKRGDSPREVQEGKQKKTKKKHRERRMRRNWSCWCWSRGAERGRKITRVVHL